MIPSCFSEVFKVLQLLHLLPLFMCGFPCSKEEPQGVWPYVGEESGCKDMFFCSSLKSRCCWNDAGICALVGMASLRQLHCTCWTFLIAWPTPVLCQPQHRRQYCVNRSMSYSRTTACWVQAISRIGSCSRTKTAKRELDQSCRYVLPTCQFLRKNLSPTHCSMTVWWLNTTQ